MYIFLIFLICLGPIIFPESKHENNRKRQIIWYALVLFVYGALRGSNVGIDVPGYCESYIEYQRMGILKIFEANEGRDPVYRVFVKLLTYISPDPQLLLAIVSFCVATSLGYFLSKIKTSPFMVILFFVGFRVYAFTLSGLRQALALSCIWVAAVMLKDKKNFKFVLFTLLGACFHISALVFILAWPISKVKTAKIPIFCAFSFLIADMLSGNRITFAISDFVFSDRFEVYAEVSGGGVSSTFLIYMSLVFFCLLIPSLVQEKPSDVFERSLAMIAVVLCVLGQKISTFFRIGYYFIIPMYMWIFKTIGLLDPRKRVAVQSILIAGVIGQYIIFGPGAGTENYSFFWEMENLMGIVRI